LRDRGWCLPHDLVGQRIRVASDEARPSCSLCQKRGGHSIEARVYAGSREEFTAKPGHLARIGVARGAIDRVETGDRDST
jgi:acetyl/propionyl-CoA carboxylase alpha subunit